MGGEVWHKYHPLTKHHSITQPHKNCILGHRDWSCDLCWFPLCTTAWRPFLFFLPNRGWTPITEWAYLYSQSCRLGQRELLGLLWMLMRIILQVRKRRSDVATRQSNGFFVVQSRQEGKNPQQDTARWMSLIVCLCAHLMREREKGRSSHLFKRIMAMWPQSVWLR